MDGNRVSLMVAARRRSGRTERVGAVLLATIGLALTLAPLVSWSHPNEMGSAPGTRPDRNSGDSGHHVAAAAGLVVTESVDAETIEPGAGLHLSVAVTNGSDAALEGVEVTNTLLPGTSYVRGEPEPAWLRDESWVARRAMPTPRQGLAAVGLNGLLYAIGGRDDVTVTDAVEVYDPVADEWASASSLQTRREQLAAAVCEGRIYVAGGHLGSEALASVEVYDPLADAWSAAAPLPEPRSDLALAALDGTLYAIGGFDAAGQPTGDVFAYDVAGDSWEQVAGIPWARRLHGLAAVSLDGRIYAFGGSSEGLMNVFDPDSGTWVWRRSTSAPRCDLVGAVVGDHVYLIGGRACDVGSASGLTGTKAYHPSTDGYVEREPMPTARYDAAAATIDGRVLVVGGTDGSTALGAVEEYTPPTVGWSLETLDPGQTAHLVLEVECSPALTRGAVVINSSAAGSPGGAFASHYAKVRVGPYEGSALIAGGPAAQRLPALAAVGDTLYVAWDQDGVIALSKSADRGASWSGPTLVATGTQPSLATAPAANHDTQLHLVWRNAGVISHTVVAAEGALGIGPTTTISDDAGVESVGDPDLALDAAGQLYVVWLDDYSRLEFAKSTDGGYSWATQVITDDFCHGWAAPARVAVSPSGGHVHITWQAPDAPCGSLILDQYAGSADGGDTWQRQRWSLGHGTYHPDLAAAGEQDVYILSDADSNYWHSVKLLSSRNSGVSFNYTRTTSVSDELVRQTGSRMMSAPAIDVRGSAVAVAWDTKLHGDYDILFDASADGGRTFGHDHPVTVDSSAQTRPQVVVAGDDPWAYVVWYDERHSGDVWGQHISLAPEPTATPTVAATPSPSATVTPTLTPTSEPGKTIYLPVVEKNHCPPRVFLTAVPAIGSEADLRGRVDCVDPDQARIFVAIFTHGWYSKPSWDSPLTRIAPDGTWSCDVTTGLGDSQATVLAAFLVDEDYTPPRLAGEWALPAGLIRDCLGLAGVGREPNRRAIQFSGRKWFVKGSETRTGPGNNCFSDAEDDIWVDESGRLHLTIGQGDDGRWQCTEVYLARSLGLGSYVYRLEGLSRPLDIYPVVGLFTYDHDPSYAHREVDIEFARWGDPALANGQYVLQPYTTPSHMYRFEVDLSGPTTHGFQWRSDGSIYWQSLRGHGEFPGLEDHEITSWIYTGDDVPPPGNERARINFWLHGARPPSDGRPVEIVVSSFEFIPPD